MQQVTSVLLVSWVSFKKIYRTNQKTVELCHIVRFEAISDINTQFTRFAVCEKEKYYSCRFRERLTIVLFPEMSAFSRIYAEGNMSHGKKRKWKLKSSREREHGHVHLCEGDRILSRTDQWWKDRVQSSRLTFTTSFYGEVINCLELESATRIHLSPFQVRSRHCACALHWWLSLTYFIKHLLRDRLRDSYSRVIFVTTRWFHS